MWARIVLVGGVVVGVGAVAYAGVSPSAPVNAQTISQLTGPRSQNDTLCKWGIGGTDVGAMWDAGTSCFPLNSSGPKPCMVMAFGDTFSSNRWIAGQPTPPGSTWVDPRTGDVCDPAWRSRNPGGPPNICEPDGVGWDPQWKKDWRASTLAFTTDRSPADGIRFDTMYTTGSPTWAQSTLPMQQQTDCRPFAFHEFGPPLLCSGECEGSKIPTGGIYANGKNHMFFFNARWWNKQKGGDWQTVYSGFASSVDGLCWTLPAENNRWDCNSKFATAAVARGRDGYIYLFGTPSGKTMDIFLARVLEANIEEKSRYEYWTGSCWAYGEQSAVPIIAGPAGAEFSVRWNGHFNRWIMLTTNSTTPVGDNTVGLEAIIVRDAPNPWGPWTGGKLVDSRWRYADKPICAASGKGGAWIYGGFMYPYDTGADVYYTHSIWEDYNVFWMKTTLKVDNLGDNMLGDPGFEDQAWRPGVCTMSDQEVCLPRANSAFKPWETKPATLPSRFGGTPIGADIEWAAAQKARSGANNLMVGGPDAPVGQWRDAHQRVVLAPGQTYQLKAWLRTDPDNAGGFFGVRRRDTQAVIQEVHFGQLNAYTPVTVNFVAPPAPAATAYPAPVSYEVFIGQWKRTSGSWVRADDVSLTPGMVGERVTNPGFEIDPANPGTNGRLGDLGVGGAWKYEGTDAHGVDTNFAWGRNGSKGNAWIHPAPTNSRRWNGISQEVPVVPNALHTYQVWVRHSGITTGSVGVRDANNNLLAATPIVPGSGYIPISVSFRANGPTANIHVGYTPPPGDSWLQIDDATVFQTSSPNVAQACVP